MYLLSKVLLGGNFCVLKGHLFQIQVDIMYFVIHDIFYVMNQGGLFKNSRGEVFWSKGGGGGLWMVKNSEARILTNVV